jgi:hypothetical protein
MSEHSELIVRRMVQIQIPPEQQQLLHPPDVAELPPGPDRPPVCDTLFAVRNDPEPVKSAEAAGDRWVPQTPPTEPEIADSDKATVATSSTPSQEEKQAEAAMVLLFAQQLALTHGAKERRLPEPPDRPRRRHDDESDDA